ncbi:AzlD domain-containing protein [Deinococcus maricopensis]|uniref:Branched-chain amino acid transport n=1 Tax=Deinococcus maricopensis (strain DSM 21211 / LMG 22137 / NRRL B-23946 / LB-34) TaxID=709986 RepID=E8U3K1_DEIML|nr:AzlD domain-containing protein [Deinococcus maricopensis]ADV68625.1 branched-chain amino acid transport [Deinococcus maricopensis DSM 21211]
MSAVWIILGMWAITFATRFVGLRLSGWSLTPFWRAFLEFVPPSVFAALVVPSSVNAPDWPVRLVALALAGVALWRTGALWVGLLVGMGAYWALRAVL